MEIQHKNLNLLQVFEVIAQELNLTQASARLGLSQPALSHALQRLRDDFKDPLFSRVPRGLTPTPKALALRPGIRRVLESVEALYETDVTGDPKTFSGSVRISTTTYFEQIVIGPFLKVLQDQTPDLRLITHSLATEHEELPKLALERGDIDLAVAGFFKHVPEGFLRMKLFEDPFVVVGRKRHPYFKTKQSAEDLVAYSHVMISLRGDLQGRVDEELKRQGLKRKVVAGLGNFLSPGWVLPETDFLLVCPSKLAHSYANFLPIQFAPVPVKMRPVEMQMIWHERTQKSPHLKWVRNQLKAMS